MTEIVFDGMMLVLVMACIGFTIKGSVSTRFYVENSFYVRAILRDKEYRRFFTAPFLHLNAVHLLINALVLFLFLFKQKWEDPGGYLLTAKENLIIFILGIFVGHIFSLIVHRNHHAFRSVGASAGVNAVLFAHIFTHPADSLLFPLIDGIGIPIWILGIFFLLFSMYGIRTPQGSIGYAGFWGGAFVGNVYPLLLDPGLIRENTLLFFTLLIPILAFTFLMLNSPERSKFLRYAYKKHTAKIVEKAKQTLNTQNFLDKESELNALLEKVSKIGFGQLSFQEQQRLRQLSNSIDES